MESPTTSSLPITNIMSTLLCSSTSASFLVLSKLPELIPCKAFPAVRCRAFDSCPDVAYHRRDVIVEVEASPSS
jgi:hypothetical protein